MKANVKWREIEWECFYQTQAASLEAETLSGLEAVRNVFALALKRNPGIAEFSPLALWDLHYLREIDDADISTGWTGKHSWQLTR